MSGDEMTPQLHVTWLPRVDQEIRSRALTAAVHSFPRDDVASDTQERALDILARADVFRRYIEAKR